MIRKDTGKGEGATRGEKGVLGWRVQREEQDEGERKNWGREQIEKGERRREETSRKGNAE